MPTIKEIARKAGVSIGTVDRVIHNRGRVSPETEIRVRKAIKDLDYKPNLFARNLKLSRTFHFGIIMPRPDQDCHYWELPCKGINRACEELSAYRIEVKYYYFDRFSPASFFKACSQLEQAKTDGILLAPVLTEAATSFISTIKIPFVFFDTFVPGADCLACIRQDSYLSGRLSARLMEMLVGKKGELAVLKMMPADYHIDERVRGFREYYSNHRDITVNLHHCAAEYEPEPFKQLMDSMIKEPPAGLFVTNALTFHTVRHLKYRNLECQTHIIGYDLIRDNVACLKENTIDFIISQQPERQGYEGIYTLYRHIVLKHSVSPNIMMPIDIITRENVDYYQG